MSECPLSGYVAPVKLTTDCIVASNVATMVMFPLHYIHTLDASCTLYCVPPCCLCGQALVYSISCADWLCSAGGVVCSTVYVCAYVWVPLYVCVCSFVYTTEISCAVGFLP